MWPSSYVGDVASASAKEVAVSVFAGYVIGLIVLVAAAAFAEPFTLSLAAPFVAAVAAWFIAERGGVLSRRGALATGAVAAAVLVLAWLALLVGAELLFGDLAQIV